MAMYFDPKKVQPIVMEYKKVYWEAHNKKMEADSVDQQEEKTVNDLLFQTRMYEESNIAKEKAKVLFGSIYEDLYNTIKGVIFTHKMLINHNFDDLMSIALEALLGKAGLAKFDPDYMGKGKAENRLFSFISLVSYRAIRFYNITCIKTSKDVSLPETEREQIGLIKEDDLLREDNLDISLFINEIDQYIRPKFIDTREYSVYDFLIKYIRMNGGKFNKRDFFRIVIKNLNTDEDIIQRMKLHKDRPNCRTRAGRHVRQTIKSFQIYLKEYLHLSKTSDKMRRTQVGSNVFYPTTSE